MSAVVLAHGHQARDDLLVQLEGEDWNQHGARLATPRTKEAWPNLADVTAHAPFMRLIKSG